MLASSSAPPSYAAGSVAEAVAHGNIPGQRDAAERLVEKIRLYSLMRSRLIRDAEECRRQGRWTKASRLECEAGFFGAQAVIFRDALTKMHSDGSAFPVAVSVEADQIVIAMEIDSTGLSAAAIGSGSNPCINSGEQHG